MKAKFLFKSTPGKKKKKQLFFPLLNKLALKEMSIQTNSGAFLHLPLFVVSGE